MNSADMLRQVRGSGYGEKPADAAGPRSFPLSEEENIPDGPCCVKAYGTAGDGKFVIDRIEPEEGAENEDAIMVKNQSQLSPS